jgi:hypothetical protein
VRLYQKGKKKTEEKNRYVIEAQKEAVNKEMEGTSFKP